MDFNYKDLKKETINTIEKIAFPYFKIASWDKVNDEIIGEIVDYLVQSFEAPVIEDDMAGKKIDQQLLKDVTNAITDVTTQNWW